MSNWKTTTLGVLTIIAALCGVGIAALQGHSIDYTSVIAAITAGVGLITAKDSTPSTPSTGGTALLALVAFGALAFAPQAFAAPVIIKKTTTVTAPAASGKLKADSTTTTTTTDTSTCTSTTVLGISGYLCPGLTLSVGSLKLDGTVETSTDPGVGVTFVAGEGLKQIGVGLYGVVNATSGEQGASVALIGTFLNGYLDLGLSTQLVGDANVFDDAKSATKFIVSTNFLKIAGLSE